MCVVCFQLSNVLHARELNCKLQEEGHGDRVLAVAVHPGVIITELQKHMKPMPAPLALIGKATVLPFLKSIDQGAATSVYCATAKDGDIKGGEFYADCNVSGSAPHAKDRAMGKRLWELSEKLTRNFQ